MRLLLCFTILVSCSLYGKEIRYGVEDVYLPISKEGAHLFFDESIVSTSDYSYFSINSAEHKQVSKKNYRSVFVKWSRGKIEERISFLLANRKKVYVVFKYIKSPGIMKLHDTYTFIKKRNITASNTEDLPLKIQAINLLKAMKKREFVKGYSSNRANIELKDGHKKIRTYLKGVYAGRNLNGFFITVKNDKKTQVLIGHDSIRVGRPDLAMVSYISKKKLRHTESAHLFIVTKKRARHKQIFIPYYLITGKVL